jgi:hypothetical protein
VSNFQLPQIYEPSQSIARDQSLNPHNAVRLGKYLKVAFLNKWNLLAFLGGTVFAFLSPFPDAVLALVAAGELTYLGLLGTHPKFQAYVEVTSFEFLYQML